MKKLVVAIVSAVASAVGLTAFAAEINWIGSATSCDWDVASNWEGGVVPGNNDTAVFSGTEGVTYGTATRAARG